jgi:hypothetical protein
VGVLFIGNKNIEIESDNFFTTTNSIDDLIKNLGREKNNLRDH